MKSISPQYFYTTGFLIVLVLAAYTRLIQHSSDADVLLSLLVGALLHALDPNTPIGLGARTQQAGQQPSPSTQSTTSDPITIPLTLDTSQMDAQIAEAQAKLQALFSAASLPHINIPSYAIPTNAPTQMTFTQTMPPAPGATAAPPQPAPAAAPPPAAVTAAPAQA